MFPFQRSCELSFKIDEEDDPYEQNIKDKIMLENNAVVEVQNNNLDHPNNNINRGRGRGRGQGRGRGRARGGRSGSFASSSSTNNIDDEEKKRIFHRETERQRRHEMSTLFDSLRSVIPVHQLKGRKSITDHLEEATNYIKDLEKNVKELGEKRDELKKFIQPTSSGNELGGSSNSSPPYSVVIRQFLGGLEIQICVKDNDVQFLLSKALQVASEEGLEVVSSTSTKFHERFIHSILSEVSDVTCIDLNRLEQRLNDLFPQIR